MSKDNDSGKLELETLGAGQGKAVFESRDIYGGPERRKFHRRQAVERRTKLRFEPGKCIERRIVSDRRKSEGWNTGSAI